MPAEPQRQAQPPAKTQAAPRKVRFNVGENEQSRYLHLDDPP